MIRVLASGRGPNKHCETAGRQFLEFNTRFAESFFDSQARRLSGSRRAIFDPIDRTLRNAGSFTEVGLTPTQHGPAGTELGGEELPFVLNTTRRQVYFRVFVHERVFVSEYLTKKKSPAEGPPGIVEFIPRSSDQGRKSR
jgi:hypothetical protein